MNKNYRHLLCCLTGGALLFAVPGFTAAAEPTSNNAENQEFSLPEYVITANRIPLKITETAANVTVIDQAAIDKGHFNTVADILKQVITIEQDSTGARPIINGDPRVLILIDGRRMNWDQVVTSGSKGGVNLSQLNADSVEKIEIVHGPASSLYGSDAAGGVINIMTRKASAQSTSITSEIGSNGFLRHSITTENKFANGFSYRLSLAKEKQGDFAYKDGNSGQEKHFDRSYYDNKSASLKLSQELDNGRSLSLDIDHRKHSGGYNLTMPGDGSYYYPQGTETGEDNNVAVTYQLSNTDYFRYYHNQSKDFIFYSPGSVYNIHRKADGVDWQNSLKLSDRHTLTSGLSWYNAAFDYSSQGINNTYSTRAVFFEDRWALNPDWSLTFGSRYDNHSIIGSHTTSRVTVNRQLNDDSNLFLSWGQFVKAPLVEDMFSNTAWFVGNPNLKPETGETITLGGNTKLGDGTKLSASVFKSKVTNAIDYDYSGSRGTAVNIAQQKRQGLDLTLSHRLSSQWNVTAGYSYVQVKNKNNAAASYINDPDNSQPNGYRLGLQYAQDKWDVEANLHGVSGRSLTSYSASSYLTLDLIANYRLSDKTRLFAKVMNLTNEGYEIRGSQAGLWIQPGAYHMPGRTFIVGLEQKI